MSKCWKVLYNGSLMIRCLTRKGAESKAYQLCKDKELDFAKVEVREDSHE